MGFALAVATSLLLAVAARWVLLDVIRFPRPSDTPQILTVFLSSFVILLVSSTSMGHYSQFRPFWLELREVFRIVLIIAALDVFLLYVIGVTFSRLWFGFFLLSLLVIIPLGRELSKRMMIRAGIWYEPTLIAGTGDSALKTLTALQSDSSLGHEVIGFVDLEASPGEDRYLQELPVLTSIPPDTNGEELSASDPSRSKTNPRVVFAFDTVEELQRHETILSNYMATHSSVTVIPPPMGLSLYGASVTGIFRHDTALLKLQNRLLNRRSRIIKRAMDISLGVTFLVLFSPLFVLISVLIKRDGGPVLFAHRRVGRNNREFDCYKFRSMKVNSDSMLDSYLQAHPTQKDEWEHKRKLKNDPRVTRVGAYLRKTSMDELPQLVNVLKGEMSLVGPRPAMRPVLEKYASYKPYYLKMTPGMSGLWQVSGRSDTSFEERIRLDVWYSQNWSLWTDMVILIKTVKTVAYRHGAY